MNFEDLFAKRANHIKPGLERIRASFEALNQPSIKTPTVLIGGTNGKGSTSGFIWSMLALSGKRIGLYSSPHLINFSERFMLSGMDIDDAYVAKAYEALLSDLPQARQAELSFFEIATLLGFRIFAEAKADAQVLEVGLGGRWDATNISQPLASIVVSVSQDHKEFLGTDTLGILREKFAIARPGAPLFWGAQGEVMDEAGLEDCIEDAIAESGAILYTRGKEFFTSETHLHLRLPGLKPLDLPWQGVFAKAPDYLKRNLSLAAAYYHWFVDHSQDSYPALDTIWDSFCQGSSKAPVTLVGRAQKLLAKDGSKRKYLVDVCHNPDGARAFASAVEGLYPATQIPAFVCILKDKECDSILDILRSVLSPVILFGIESERSWDLASLASRHRDLPFYPSLDAALASQSSKARQGEPWAICGSVAAVGHALQTLKVSPKELTLASIISGDWTPDSQRTRD